jgi:thymidylate kinase
LSFEPLANPPLRGRGGYIVVAGPDGTGKSSLCDAIERDLLPGCQVLRVHHRPGVLRFSRGEKAPVTEPHRDPPFGAAKSFAKYLYLWADFMLGWFVRFRPFIASGGWVIMERGWWDTVVDPTRYRLDPGVGVGALLGRTLHDPDFLAVLEAPVEVIARRKTELPDTELRRQMEAWHRLPRSVRPNFLDASASQERLVTLMARQMQTHGSGTGEKGEGGWAALPYRSTPRWWLPKAPRSVARAGVFVYHPVTNGGLIGWRLAHMLASSGGFRMFHGSEIDGLIPDAVWRGVPSGHTLAVARSNHPGNFVALLIAPNGTRRAALKIATDESGCRSLEKEREILQTLGPRLPPPLSAPKVLAYEEGLLWLEPVAWRPRTRPWLLESEVCFALGRFFASRKGPRSKADHPAHGDFAPWNLLRTRSGWMVIDWEDAFFGAAPFHDVFTYLVQAHTLLHRPTTRAFEEGIRGGGWIGEAIRGFAYGADVSERDAKRYLIEYLERSSESFDPAGHGAAGALASRQRLLGAIGP